MIARLFTVLIGVVSFFQHGAAAAPTWPASTDELEDIMFLNTGYRARGFAVPVTPCTSEGVEGFISAAQWIRLAFHDMGTANVFTGVGGLDASIVFEMWSGTNNSPGLNVSLEQFAPFLSTRSSMSDIIALSVYTSVRACGGPVVPIRGGRVDATAQGPSPDVFLPQPQNSLFTFESQFQRLGFNTAQMIAVVACGHTVGQVHSSTFPQIATAGTKNLDSTPAVFDEKVASEYLAGTSSDLLVVGPSGFDSDLTVFAADKNVTITSMATPATFDSMCSTALQQMIEVVPTGVKLTDPIVPYDVKPYALQLTLLNGGATMSFTGEIRIRTTTLSVTSVQLVFIDRNGGNQCGSNGCTISTTPAGSSAGFDDTFAFYGFSVQIPTATSISAFNVIISLTGGGTQTYNNNGAGFPVQDTIMLQSPESCLSPDGGMQNLTVVAAVRNTVTASMVNLTLTQNVPVTGILVPALQKTSVSMTLQSAFGLYNLYSASYLLNINQLANTNVKFDVSVGGGASLVADSFKDTNKLAATCATLSSPTSTTSSVGSTSTSSTSISTTSTVSTSTTSISSTVSTSTISVTSTVSTSTTIITSTVGTSTTSSPSASTSTTSSPSASTSTTSSLSASASTSSTLSTSTSTTSPLSTSTTTSVTSSLSTSATSTSTPSTSATSSTLSTSTTLASSTTSTVGTSTSSSATASAPPGWAALGCYTDNVGGRTLQNGEGVPGGSPAMTVELCVAACKAAGFMLAGVEFSQECWCDNAFNNGGGPAPDGSVGCNMNCRGNSLETCGGADRLDVYKNLEYVPVSNPTIPGYSYQGCYHEPPSGRALSDSSTAGDSMTVESCAAFCGDSNYFGVEFGRECYCGSSIPTTSTLEPSSECSFSCAGNSLEYCGAGSLLNIYQNLNYIPVTDPTIPGYTYQGCYNEPPNGRAFTASSTASNTMTVESCAAFCNGASYFGVEYGRECYCGTSIPAVSTLQPATACSFLCAGNSLEYCGAGGMLNVYKSNAI